MALVPAVMAVMALFASIHGEVKMRYAIVCDGVVVNFAVATPDYAAQQGWIECPDAVDIGWSFDGAGEPVAPPRNLEADAAEARAKRDFLLIESDLRVLPDRWAEMSSEQQSAWAAYRQALRDLPQQLLFPIQIDWPVKP